MPPAVAIGAGAVLGGIGGAFGKNDSVQTASGINIADAGTRELGAQRAVDNSFSQLQGMVNAGPGQQDVSNAYGATTDFASALQKAGQEGGLNPTGSDITRSNNLASSLFGQQRVGLQQMFDEQMRQANAQAGISGRDPNDPVLRMKLAQMQMQQGGQLDASQNAMAQQLAFQMPQQRLQMMGQRADVLGGLASQAMANRQAIASMGDSIMQGERNFRLQTASHWGSQTSQSGGGIGGAITGALGGAGAGMSAAGGFANMFRGAPAPQYDYSQADGMGGGIRRIN
jgi:hypothetical protein